MNDFLYQRTTKPTGGDIPEPFNYNDVKVWLGKICKYICGKTEDNFPESEFLLNPELNQSHAYDNEKEKHKAMYDSNHPYSKLLLYCLQWLITKGLLETRIVNDVDNSELKEYIKTDKLKNICSQILRYDLADIHEMANYL